MSAKQMLEKYMREHPDFWEFENEMIEVARLKKLCNDEAMKQTILPIQKYAQLQLCV